MRLDKLLAHMNYGSRKEVKSFIRKGYVLVNGEVVRNDDFKVDEELDEIVILEEEVTFKKTVYFIMHKPKGYVCANTDTRDPTIFELLDCAQRGLFTIGRLDKDTTGLLLITNDGTLAHELLSPKYHVNKTYEVTFQGIYKDAFQQKFKEGIVLEDGYVCKSATFELLDSQKGRITIHEGKFHQIKRMMSALGLKVVDLKRVAFGSLHLPLDLLEGSYRELTEDEIALLREKEKK